MIYRLLLLCCLCAGSPLLTAQSTIFVRSGGADSNDGMGIHRQTFNAGGRQGSSVR